MICRVSLAVAMGLPSSDTATIPASCIAAISDVASPCFRPRPRRWAKRARALGLGALDDAARDRGAVVHRPGVGHATDRGESAASGRPRSSLNRFGLFLARLPKMDMHIDEARRDDQVRSIENLYIGATETCLGRDFLMRPSLINTSLVASVWEAGSSTRPFLIRSMSSFL